MPVFTQRQHSKAFFRLMDAKDHYIYLSGRMPTVGWVTELEFEQLLIEISAPFPPMVALKIRTKVRPDKLIVSDMRIKLIKGVNGHLLYVS